MIDDNNCRTCTCNKPCANPKCRPGEECRADVLPCSSTGEPCGYIEKCGAPCPLLDCVPYCPYGEKLDENGCLTCECIDHCKNLPCAPGEMCTVENITDFNAAGGVRYKCTNGSQTDCDNCASKNPCNGVHCSRGHYCEVETIYCITQPCPPPFAYCKPYCPENSWPLLGIYDYAVQCTAGAWKCPKGYDCVNIPYLNQAYCCSTQ
ncbi:antistasin-like isoform X2 [Photinus pyralis]|nr:antistasin-like isoform X2 [Photinus pyralis]XP_031341965.1 antistasin-like isoform X2 [Photinus pyralis]